MRAEHALVAAADVARRHHADAHERALGTQHRHRPREPARRDVLAEMQLDVAGMPRRQLALRRLQVGRRQAEAEPPLELVGGAAGEHGETRLGPSAPPTVARTPACVGVERGDARADADLGAGRDRAIGERAIEDRPIDHRRERRRRACSRPGMPPGERNRTDVSWLSVACRGRSKLAKLSRREHAGAVHRIADARVLFADQRPHAALGQTRRHEESTGAAAHDEDVDRAYP